MSYIRTYVANNNINIKVHLLNILFLLRVTNRAVYLSSDGESMGLAPLPSYMDDPRDVQ